MKPLLRTSGLLVVLAASIFLTSCVSGATRPLEHGIHANVKGAQTVRDIKILYGDQVVRFPNNYGPGAQSGWNAPMAIPDSMTVIWKVGDTTKEQVVPLKGKTVAQNRLANWQIYFFDERIEVWREDDEPSSAYNFKPRVQIYP